MRTISRFSLSLAARHIQKRRYKNILSGIPAIP